MAAAVHAQATLYATIISVALGDAAADTPAQLCHLDIRKRASARA
jgi:hypothetical protein